MTIAPAARTAATRRSSCAGTWSRKMTLPWVVRQAGGLLQVLDADRQAVQRPQLVAAQHRGVGGLRAGTGAVEVARHHRVHRVIHRLDPRDAAFQQLAGRQTLRADQAPRVDGGQVAGFGHGVSPCGRGGTGRARCARKHFKDGRGRDGDHA